jgi:hypothetical protein
MVGGVASAESDRGLGWQENGRGGSWVGKLLLDPLS